MTICIVHYHLNPGGVTRIIDSQIKAIRTENPSAQIQIITGHCSDKAPYAANKVEIIIDERINYLKSPNQLQKEALDDTLGFFGNLNTPNTIFHVHNLNLGKNPLVTMALSELAYRGTKLVNHAHDFAEDRPANINFLKQAAKSLSNRELHAILYPDLPNYQFVTLTRFDYTRLIDFGVNKNNCHILPNPVFFESLIHKEHTEDLRTKIAQQLKISPALKWVTYPVRVIERKNIAEFILLAWIFRHRAVWLVTQAPKNIAEITQYEIWKQFCVQNNIPVIWEAGEKVNFEELLTASDFCISTSIREGFGMVFLEPWLFGTPVIGRNIPAVTDDFVSDGIHFPCIYEKIIIDNNGFELHQLKAEEQHNFLTDIINSPQKINDLIEGNKFLKNLLDLIPDSVINKNKGVILKKYSIQKYGVRLNRIYQDLTGKCK